MQTARDLFNGIIPRHRQLTSTTAFLAWYDAHELNSTEPPVTWWDRTVPPEPTDTPGASYIQRYKAISSAFRDQNLATKIQQALDAYGDVMVVYGAGHLPVFRPLFEKNMVCTDVANYHEEFEAERKRG
ncbi:TraB/GumN family protein [Trinickia sp. LjRoot230]|uniref:hypothetical protein n=1 Tax=Trinickia sp. LjRoot230 TaxID=3342288 RepID=UPI003ECF187B